MLFRYEKPGGAKYATVNLSVKTGRDRLGLQDSPHPDHSRQTATSCHTEVLVYLVFWYAWRAAFCRQQCNRMDYGIALS